MWSTYQTAVSKEVKRPPFYKITSIQSVMASEDFSLITKCGSVLMLSSIDRSTQASKSFMASVLICWSLAASNLSWHTIKDLFNLSCITHKDAILSNTKRKTLIKMHVEETSPYVRYPSHFLGHARYKLQCNLFGKGKLVQLQSKLYGIKQIV